jgi:hypothetical protein
MQRGQRSWQSYLHAFSAGRGVGSRNDSRGRAALAAAAAAGVGAKVSLRVSAERTHD